MLSTHARVSNVTSSAHKLRRLPSVSSSEIFIISLRTRSSNSDALLRR